MPHLAKRLDNNPILQSPYEVLISVQLLYLPESSLVLSLQKLGGNNLSQGITKALAEAGKVAATSDENVKDRFETIMQHAVGVQTADPSISQRMDRGHRSPNR